MDLFHSLDNLKSQLASVAFCMNTGVYNVRNGSVIRASRCRLDKWVSPSLIGGGRLLSTLLSAMLSIACSVSFLLFVSSENNKKDTLFYHYGQAGRHGVNHYQRLHIPSKLLRRRLPSFPRPSDDDDIYPNTVILQCTPLGVVLKLN